MSSGNVPAVYDAGTISATIDGTTASYTWGSSSTAASIATGLAAAISTADGGILVASASGDTVQLTSKSTGTAMHDAYSKFPLP